MLCIAVYSARLCVVLCIAVVPLLVAGVAEQIGTPPTPSTVDALFSCQHVLQIADCPAMSYIELADQQSANVLN